MVTYRDPDIKVSLPVRGMLYPGHNDNILRFIRNHTFPYFRVTTFIIRCFSCLYYFYGQGRIFIDGWSDMKAH